MDKFDKQMDELRNLARDAIHAAVDENGNPVTPQSYRDKTLKAAELAGCATERDKRVFLAGVRMGRASALIDMANTHAAASAEMISFTMDALK